MSMLCAHPIRWYRLLAVKVGKGVGARNR